MFLNIQLNVYIIDRSFSKKGYTDVRIQIVDFLSSKGEKTHSIIWFSPWMMMWPTIAVLDVAALTYPTTFFRIITEKSKRCLQLTNRKKWQRDLLNIVREQHDRSGCPKSWSQLHILYLSKESNYIKLLSNACHISITENYITIISAITLLPSPTLDHTYQKIGDLESFEPTVWVCFSTVESIICVELGKARKWKRMALFCLVTCQWEHRITFCHRNTPFDWHRSGSTTDRRLFVQTNH